MTKERFTSPVGRLVQGDLDEPQTKDAQGNLRTVKTGPNIGQPNPQYFIAVAFAKTDPAWPAFWSLLVTKAAADFPNLFPGGPGAACIHPNFAFKVIDGDDPTPNQSGRLWNTYEGFAGHYVVRFGSAYPPRCFHAGRYAANEQIQEKGAIKRGYFVRVSGTVEGNANAQRPGIYVNLDMVELSAYGPEIVSGPDAGEAFGAAPAALPAGASPTPLTPPAPVAGAPAPLAPPTAAASPLPVAALPVAASPAPYTGYMGNAGLPPAVGAGGVVPPATSPAPLAPPAAPLAPIASPSRVMLPAAGAHTYESLIAAGWTDDTLRANGMMQ